MGAWSHAPSLFGQAKTLTFLPCLCALLVISLILLLLLFPWIDDPSHAETTPVVSFDYRLCGITSLIQGRSRSRRIRELTSKAHKQGKKVRVFACPNKEGAWDQVFRNNVDIVSVDDHERFRKYCAGRLNDEGGSFL